MNNQQNNKLFWKNYWSSRNPVQEIDENCAFHNLFEETLKDRKYKSMIEVGGFPGYYAIYFHKFWDYRTTLLDYIVDMKTVNKLLKKNKLKSNDIEIIKKDFRKENVSKKYDLVFSLGFIEHFGNTQEIIKRHWKMVNGGGQMIIGIPNFLGVNGLYQYLFDPSNLNIHNLESMRSEQLTKIVNKLKPKSAKVVYASTGLVWLENLENKSSLLRLTTRVLNAVGTGLSALGIKNKLISTHLFIIAEKFK